MQPWRQATPAKGALPTATYITLMMLVHVITVLQKQLRTDTMHAYRLTAALIESQDRDDSRESRNSIIAGRINSPESIVSRLQYLSKSRPSREDPAKQLKHASSLHGKRTRFPILKLWPSYPSTCAPSSSSSAPTVPSPDSSTLTFLPPLALPSAFPRPPAPPALRFFDSSFAAVPVSLSSGRCQLCCSAEGD